MLHLLGVDHERLTFRFQGRDFRLTDVSGKVVKDVLELAATRRLCEAERRPCQARDLNERLGLVSVPRSAAQSLRVAANR